MAALLAPGVWQRAWRAGCEGMTASVKEMRGLHMIRHCSGVAAGSGILVTATW